MSKVTVSSVADILKRHKLEPALLREIVEELNEAAQPEADKEPTPKGKTQIVLLANTDASLGWALKLPEDAGPHTVLERINAATHDFNASKKGRLLPCKSIGEALENVSRKYLKNQGVQVLTKLSVAVIRTDNKLSEAPSV